MDNRRYWCGPTVGKLGFQQLPCGVIVRGNSAGLQNVTNYYYYYFRMKDCMLLITRVANDYLQGQYCLLDTGLIAGMGLDASIRGTWCWLNAASCA